MLLAVGVTDTHLNKVDNRRDRAVAQQQEEQMVSAVKQTASAVKQTASAVVDSRRVGLDHEQ